MVFLLWIGMIIATAVVADRKRLNVLGYIIFAIIFAPLALLVVLLSSPGRSVAVGSRSAATLPELKLQLDQARRALKMLESRIQGLDEALARLGGQPAIEDKTADDLTAGQPGAASAAPTDKEGAEIAFGRYWLSRLGVIIFVFGIGLFISYTFQYFNAAARIGIGYLLAVAFFWWGNRLEKMERYTKVAWGILAGAWGLLYLSTYAMYYVEATRIITSPLLELCFLGAVSAAAVVYNLKYNSWVVTALTYSLALITMGLGGIDFSSVVYMALLTGSIIYVSLHKRWYPLLVSGIIGSFLVAAMVDPYALLLKFGKVLLSDEARQYRFWIIVGMYAVNWALFSAAHFLFKDRDETERKYLLTAVSANAVFFTLLTFEQIDRVRYSLGISWDIRFVFLSVLGLVYLFYAYGYKRLGRGHLIVVNVAVALALLTAAILVKFPKLSISYLFILEMLLTLGMGIYYREAVYRIFSGFLGIVVLFRLFDVDYSNSMSFAAGPLEISHRLTVFLLAAVCFFGMGLIVKRPAWRSVLRPEEISYYPALYPVFGTFLAVMILAKEAPPQWLTLDWTLAGVVIFLCGFRLQQRFYRLSALGVLALAVLRLFFVDLDGLNTVYRIGAFISLGAVLLFISMIYAKYQVGDK